MKLFWKRILCFRSLFLTAGLTGLKVPANVGALLDLYVVDYSKKISEGTMVCCNFFFPHYLVSDLSCCQVGVNWICFTQ